MIWNKIKNFLQNKEEKIIERLITDEHDDKIKKNITKNLDYLKSNLAQSDDLIFRELFIGGHQEFNAQIIYIEELISKDVLQREVLKPLMFEIETIDENTNIKKQINNTLSKLSIPVNNVSILNSLSKAIENILSGNAVLFIDGVAKAFNLDIKTYRGRNVQRSFIEATTRGPQEAFNESLKINTALIRKRLKDNNLVIESKQIGERTKTDLALAYINDIADKDIVKKIKDRLDNIEIDGVLDIGVISQYLEGNWASPFPQFKETERPDKAVSSLLEGRIVLILNGTPFVTIVPANFIQFFQSPEDYYDRFYIGTALRILRLMAVFMAISLPAIYISLVSFHHELLPRGLAMTIAEARQGIPFPSYLEALIMELSLELLREAGIRLPGPIGQTIGIVGGIILGDAAVSAGLVSPPMVIIVALTAIATFVIPSYSAAIPLRLLRFPMMLLSAIFSVYGIMIGWLLILIHLCSLESLGQPYFAPFGPIKWADLKDTILRVPRRLMVTRPKSISTQQKDEQDRKGDYDKGGD
ncbi:spore germination protein [Sporohalobacter salinus]|uniref:spore germination protein n=1 Tax=Sporohalobacter salinus TaxID=1494606 RepID=UPI0019603FD1|nr:spore germination protein [Sporohalobacter salinus]MBM7624226.1 hypothetical protein [Sporohalobacter salinus]